MHQLGTVRGVVLMTRSLDFKLLVILKEASKKRKEKLKIRSLASRTKCRNPLTKLRTLKVKTPTTQLKL
jgi:hypothetical protein